MHIRRLAFPLLAAWAGVLHAATLPAPAGGFVLEGGVAVHGTWSAGAGVYWPWAWHHESRTGVWTGRTEAWVSGWSYRDVDGERKALVQLGLTPIVRYRFAQGRSPWFMEGGIGLTWMDRIYATPDKQFSTHFNFGSTIGGGFTFGARGEQEIGLRISHYSNAGIKHPNPGENFLQVRYAHGF